jgi:hypothetical protein
MTLGKRVSLSANREREEHIKQKIKRYLICVNIRKKTRCPFQAQRVEITARERV